MTAHLFKSQILIEVEAEGQTLKKALSILYSMGLSPVEYDVLSEKFPTSVVLISLSTTDMREGVLKLTEAGFTRLKGINPKCQGLNS